MRIKLTPALGIMDMVVLVTVTDIIPLVQVLLIYSIKCRCRPNNNINSGTILRLHLSSSNNNKDSHVTQGEDRRVSALEVKGKVEYGIKSLENSLLEFFYVLYVHTYPII